MTRAEIWSILAPTIRIPNSPTECPESYNRMIEAYVVTHIGLMLYDSWVAHGKPEEWKEMPKRKKKGDSNEGRDN